MKRILLAILFVLMVAAPVAAQEPSPTFSADVLASQAAEESRVDALPTLTAIDALPVDQVWTAIPEATEEAPANVVINIDTQPDAAPAPADVTPDEPAPPSVPADTVHVALVVGGIIAVAVIGVAAFLLKATGDQLYNSLPPLAQYGVRAGGEYLLSKAATTPQQDDDAAIEAALQALGFVVVREEDGSITLRRPAPVTQGPMPPMPSSVGLPPGQWVFVQTPPTPTPPDTEAVFAQFAADERRREIDQRAAGG